MRPQPHLRRPPLGRQAVLTAEGLVEYHHMRRHSSGPLWALLLLLLGCLMPQRSFAVISLQQAQALVRDGGVEVVNAARPGAEPPAPSPGSTGAPLPGGVLVIAATENEGFRAAAALARLGNHPTYLCISANANERGSLYALAPKRGEIVRDENY